MLGQNHHTTAPVGIVWSHAAPRRSAALRASNATTSGLVEPTDSAALIPASTSARSRWRCNSSTSTKRPGARRVAVGFARGRPKRLVLGGEHLRCAGLRQRGRPGQSARLAKQDFQIVVQIKDFGALADRTLVAGHHRIAVIDSDRRGRQFDPQPMANEPRRDTVLIAAHHHLRVAVYPRRQSQCGVE